MAVTYPVLLSKLLIHSGVARWLPAIRRLVPGAGPFLHYYSDRVLSMPLADLQDAAILLQQAGADSIDLAQGSPLFDLAPSASTKLPVDRRGFPSPWGLPALREAIADYLKQTHHLDVQPTDEVLVTPGAAGAFGIALDSLVNPGSPVALFDPCSPLYTLALRQRRARIRWIATWMEGGRTRFHMEHLIKALRWARLIVLTSPGNPTGGYLSAEDLEQIAWWADRYDVLVFEDQSFARFCYEGPALSIGTLPRAARRTLIAGSVSKGHALTAARVGWLAGYRHLVRPCTLTALLQTPFAVPTVCQQIALTALSQGDEPFQPILAEFESRRRYAFERLRGMGLSPDWPAGAYFFWVGTDHLNLTGRAFAQQLLREQRVHVTPGHLFGPSGASRIRLSYACDDGRLREGLARLAKFVQRPAVRMAA